MNDKLQEFIFSGQKLAVEFVETMQLKEGVSCDVYAFIDDDSKDLAIVTVDKGCKTPLQKILKGSRTIEGWVSGDGVLDITAEDGTVRSQLFNSQNNGSDLAVEIGQTMQWTANADTSLVIYEVCEPPYQEGRFENLT